MDEIQKCWYHSEEHVKYDLGGDYINFEAVSKKLHQIFSKRQPDLVQADSSQ